MLTASDLVVVFSDPLAPVADLLGIRVESGGSVILLVDGLAHPALNSERLAVAPPEAEARLSQLSEELVLDRPPCHLHLVGMLDRFRHTADAENNALAGGNV